MPAHSPLSHFPDDQRLIDELRAHESATAYADSQANDAVERDDDATAGWWQAEARRHRLAIADLDRRLQLEQERRRYRLFSTLITHLRADTSAHLWTGR